MRVANVVQFALVSSGIRSKMSRRSWSGDAMTLSQICRGQLRGSPVQLEPVAERGDRDAVDDVIGSTLARSRECPAQRGECGSTGEETSSMSSSWPGMPLVAMIGVTGRGVEVIVGDMSASVEGRARCSWRRKRKSCRERRPWIRPDLTAGSARSSPYPGPVHACGVLYAFTGRRDLDMVIDAGSIRAAGSSRAGCPCLGGLDAARVEAIVLGVRRRVDGSRRTAALSTRRRDLAAKKHDGRAGAGRGAGR